MCLDCLHNSTDTTHLPVLCHRLPELFATSQHYLQQLAAQQEDEQAAGPAAQQQVIENAVLRRVLSVNETLINTLHTYQEQLVASSIWQELHGHPALLNAALTHLAGMAQYLHSGQTARQQGPTTSSSNSPGSRGGSSGGNSSSRGGSSGSNSSSRGGSSGSNSSSRGGSSGGSSSSRGGETGSSGASGSSSSSSRGKRENDTSCVVGATSLADLLLPADHELIEVAGGRRVVDIRATLCGLVFAGTFADRAGQMSARKATGISLQVLSVYMVESANSSLESGSPSAAEVAGTAVGATPAAVASSSSAPAAVAAAGGCATAAAAATTPASSAGAATPAPAPAAAAPGAVPIPPPLHVLQLLLELTALLGQHHEAYGEMHSLGDVWSRVPQNVSFEERQAFLSARGALLLQVL